MTSLDTVRKLIRQGRKQEAWELVDRSLTDELRNEAAWLLVYELASESRKGRILEKARQYLPPDSAIFKRQAFSSDAKPSATFFEAGKLKSSCIAVSGLLVLVALFCGGASLIFFSSDAYTRLMGTSTPQPTRHSPITFAPTYTPLPTKTPMPTNTPLPTNTFTPQPTATYDWSAEESLYRQTAGDLFMGYLRSFQDLAYSMEQLEYYPALLYSLQNLFIELNNETRLFLRRLVNGVDNVDSAEFSRGHMENVLAISARITTELAREQ